MSEARSWRFELDLDPGAIPVAGRIRPPAGAPRPFSGYLELILELEALRVGRPRASADAVPEAAEQATER